MTQHLFVHSVIIPALSFAVLKVLLTDDKLLGSQRSEVLSHHHHMKSPAQACCACFVQDGRGAPTACGRTRSASQRAGLRSWGPTPACMGTAST